MAKSRIRKTVYDKDNFDKVIDRSNVLRFGRPEKLEVADAIDSSQTKSSPIRFSTWKKWLKDPVSENEKKLVIPMCCVHI